MTTIIQPCELTAATEGSYFTILGAGGDLQEWVDGITDALREAQIGTPAAWYVTTGAAINRHAEQGHAVIADRDRFQPDLVVLMFPLDGLAVGKLAMFKLQTGAAWFDDILDNMRSAS
jgi:hypothetical protein